MTVEKYRGLLGGSWDWSVPDAFTAIQIWWEAAHAYIESEGDPGAIDAHCGSPGEFASGADRISNWLMVKGIDPYPFWDLFLAIDERLLGEPVDIGAISKLSDRAILIYRRVYFMAEGSGGSNQPKRTARRGRPVTDESADINKFIVEHNPTQLELEKRFNLTPDAARKRIERARDKAQL